MGPLLTSTQASKRVFKTLPRASSVPSLHHTQEELLCGGRSPRQGAFDPTPQLESCLGPNPTPQVVTITMATMVMFGPPTILPRDATGLSKSVRLKPESPWPEPINLPSYNPTSSQGSPPYPLQSRRYRFTSDHLRNEGNDDLMCAGRRVHTQGGSHFDLP